MMILVLLKRAGGDGLVLCACSVMKLFRPEHQGKTTARDIKGFRSRLWRNDLARGFS
jgi:hypothetical protein